MAFEMEMVALSANIQYEWDSDRGRTLLRTDNDPGFVRLSVAGNGYEVPKDGAHVVIDFIDSNGNESKTVRYDDIRDVAEFSRFVENATGKDGFGETIRDTITIRFDSDEIIGQYDRGTYEDIAPGPMEARLVIEDRFGNGNVKFGPVTGSFNLGVPSGARVRENTEIRNLSFRVDGTTVTPSAEVAVRADHGVSLPVDVEARVGDEVVASDSLVLEDLSGARFNPPEVTPVDLLSFELDGVPYQDNRLTYRVMPRGWAEGWVNVAETARNVANISVNDVSITGCRVTPEQVVAGDQVTVRSSVNNPLPVAVGVEGRIDFAGSQSTFSRRIGAGEIASVTETFRTTDPGTAQPTIRITSVGGNV